MLMLCLTPSEKDTCDDLFTTLTNEWDIVGFEGASVPQGQALGHLKTINIYDENGDVVGDYTPTELHGIVHRFSGHQWGWE